MWQEAFIEQPNNVYADPHNTTSLRRLKVLQQTADSGQPLMEHMRVNNRRPHVTVSEQLLDRAAEQSLFHAEKLPGPARTEQARPPPAGCSKSSSSEAAASEGPEAYPLGYVEDLNDARTKLAGFFSILLD